MKFTDCEIQERVRATDGAGAAARMGRQRSLPLRRDWEEVKFDVMEDALWAKFTQHPELRHQV